MITGLCTPDPPASWRARLRAIRAFSFTASIIPVVLAAFLALSQGAPVRWGLFLPVLAGAVLLHAGTNLVSDAADFRRGVDRKGTLGGSGVLVAGLLTPRQVFRDGIVLLGAGAAIGLFLVWTSGAPVLWIGLAGVIGGFFYGGRSFGYKYWALGDAAVFLLMGPLLVLGPYFVLTGSFHSHALLLSLPVGCLVTAILSSNNMRDIRHDAEAGVRTLATILGFGAAKAQYALLVAGAYVLVGGMVLSGVLSAWCLGVLLSAPLAFRNVKAALSARPERTEEIASIDVRTAQLHLLFGALLSLGLLASALRG